MQSDCARALGHGWAETDGSGDPAVSKRYSDLRPILKVMIVLCIALATILYAARQKSKGVKEVLWLKTVLSSGTLSDKVAALTLLIQESPFHTQASLDTLLAMASKKGKRESILAAGTVCAT